MNTINKQIDREEEIVFTNFTKEEYDGMWNKKVYRMEAGKSYYLPFYLAEHFAQGLVDRELNRAMDAARKKLAPRDRSDRKRIEEIEFQILKNSGTRQQMMDKCIEKMEDKEVQVEIIHPKEVPREVVESRSMEKSQQLLDQGVVSKSDLTPYNTPKG